MRMQEIMDMLNKCYLDTITMKIHQPCYIKILQKNGKMDLCTEVCLDTSYNLLQLSAIQLKPEYKVLGDQVIPLTRQQVLKVKKYLEQKYFDNI